MSPTSFHQHFKAVTGMTPIQCQRRIRLQEARKSLLIESINIGEASVRDRVARREPVPPGGDQPGGAGEPTAPDHQRGYWGRDHNQHGSERIAARALPVQAHYHTINWARLLAFVPGVIRNKNRR
jgi:hypothetical protein